MPVHQSILGLAGGLGGILGGISPLGGLGAGLLNGGAAPTPTPTPTGGEMAVVPGLDLGLDPVALAAQLIGLPFDTLGTVLEMVGLQTGIGQGPGGLAGMAGAVRPAAPIDLTGFSRGNGRTANRTVVETLDLVTNRIIRRRILPGTPHMMNSDIRAAKKVFRQSAKLHAKLPRRTTKESETTKLKNAAVQQAIAHVTCPPQCPPRS